jgi:AcrR family transcriptional regulator
LVSFGEREKEQIREELLRAGEKSFARMGLKRTRVEDLTAEAGIAKGSFYAFFPSKEALCFAVLEEEERRLGTLFGENLRRVASAEELETIIVQAFDALEESAVAMRLYELEEFPVLLRKIPKEAVERHQQHDRERMERLLSQLPGQSHFAKQDPDVVSGLFRALFMLGLERGVIGEAVFPQVRRHLIRSVARELWGKNGTDG